MGPEEWFKRRTFDYKEFGTLKDVVNLKKKKGKTVSLVIPTLNEAKNIGFVIKKLMPLKEKYGLVDEFFVVDSGSTDKTREIAKSLGADVYLDEEILPEIPIIHGKGENLWRSLYITRGDIIVWVDADIRNMHPRFVYGLIAPLLKRKDIRFTKAFYRRPIKIGRILRETGGGRVTELTARPLFDLFYPDLGLVIQPLSGEYAITRDIAERIPFFTGYGVETGMLIDIYKYFGLEIMAQVNLRVRVHRNQDLSSLRKMATRIMAVGLKRAHENGKLFIKEFNRKMKIISSELGKYKISKIIEIIGSERSPIISVPAYRKKFNIPEEDLAVAPISSGKTKLVLISSLLNENLILDVKSKSGEAAIREMVRKLTEREIVFVKTKGEIIKKLLAQYKRDAFGVGIGRGIAVPHIHSDIIQHPILAVGLSKEGVDFVTLDGKPVYIIFMILAPMSMRKEYLGWLATIAKLFGEHSEKNRISLRKARNPKEVLQVIKIAEEILRLNTEREKIIHRR